MKKILFFVCIAMAMVGCCNCDEKKAEQKANTKGLSPNSASIDESAESADIEEFGPNEANKKTLAACDFFGGAAGMNVDTQATWLINNQAAICHDDDLKKCIKNLHLIKTTADYITARDAYWTALGKPYVETPFKMSEFMEECNYSAYFSFDPDSKGKIHKNRIGYFSLVSSCYSIPFFESLRLNYPTNINANTDLIFTMGKMNGQDVVMFRIDGIADTYFDFSHFPMGRGSLYLKSKKYIPGKNPF